MRVGFACRLFFRACSACPFERLGVGTEAFLSPSFVRCWLACCSVLTDHTCLLLWYLCALSWKLGGVDYFAAETGRPFGRLQHVPRQEVSWSMCIISSSFRGSCQRRSSFMSWSSMRSKVQPHVDCSYSLPLFLLAALSTA